LSLSTLEKHLKIAACDGVLEFFPQETLVYKNVDGGRQYAGPVLSLEKADSVYVLLAPEYQLSFLFALGCVLPDGHGDRQEDRHNAQRDEQDGHRVAVLTP